MRSPLRLMAIIAMIWCGLSLGAPSPAAVAQVRNFQWRLRGAAAHGQFDVELAKLKPLLERQVEVLLQSKSPRLFKRFRMLTRRYERGRLVSDKVVLEPARAGANRVDFDLRGRVVADRYARVVRWKRRRPSVRWVRRGTAPLARYQLTGQAVLSAVSGERLAGRPLRIVVRGKRLRATIKIPVRLQVSVKLRNRKLTTRRLAVLNKRLLRRQPLLGTAHLVSFVFQRSTARSLRVRFVAR